MLDPANLAVDLGRTRFVRWEQWKTVGHSIPASCRHHVNQTSSSIPPFLSFLTALHLHLLTVTVLHIYSVAGFIILSLVDSIPFTDSSIASPTREILQFP